MTFARNSIILLTAGAIAGCANVNPNKGFEEVGQTVHFRTGKRIAWIRGSMEDAQAASAVTTLLRRTLTADSAVQIALLNNRNIQATYEELGIAQADLVEAGLLKNPVFSFERRFPGQALQADIAEDFVSIFLLPLRKRVAQAQFDAAKMRVAHEVLQLAAEVRSAFYEQQGNEQMYDLLRQVENATEQSAETSLRLHEAGNIKNVELANQEALHVQAKLDLGKAQMEGVSSREKLNKLMGLWGSQTDWEITPRLPDLPKSDISLQGVESRAIAQRLDLAASRQELLALARGSSFARIEGILGERTEITGHLEREGEGFTSFGPSLAIPVPVFNQGQPAVARSSGRLRQAEQKYLALAAEIRADVRTARDRMLLARDRAEYYRSVALPLRSRIVDESQLEYNAMQIGAIQLLQAKQDQINASRDYVEALQSYWMARADLERAVGGKLTGTISNIGTELAKQSLEKATSHHAL